MIIILNFSMQNVQTTFLNIKCSKTDEKKIKSFAIFLACKLVRTNAQITTIVIIILSCYIKQKTISIEI